MNDFLKWIGRALLGPIGGIAGTGAFLLNRFDGGTRSNYLDDIWNGASELLGLKKPLQEQLDSYTNTITQAEPTGRDLWLANREDTVNQRTVADLRAAGLNPALMYSGGASQVPVSSASSGNSVGISDILQLAMLPLHMESIKADIAYKKADTQGKIIQNEGESKRNAWIDIMNQAKLRSENARASLDEETINQVRQRIEESKASTAKQIEEAKTEERKRELMASQILLNNANAENIEAVRPYQIALLESETEAEYSEASWKMIQTAREKKLINDGYIDAMIKAMKADTTVKEVEAYLSSDTFGEPENNVVSRVARKIVVGVNNAIRVISPIKSKF